MHGPFRMHGQPQPAALDHCARAITGDKGRHGQIFGIDAQKQMAHGRIAHGNDAVHMVLVDGEAPEKPRMVSEMPLMVTACIFSRFHGLLQR
mgnify:CR=1 FL=1